MFLKHQCFSSCSDCSGTTRGGLVWEQRTERRQGGEETRGLVISPVVLRPVWAVAFKVRPT